MSKAFIVGGVAMQVPVIVGAGACKTPQSMLPYMRPDVSVGAVVTGSYTPKERAGNQGRLFWPDDFSEFVKRGFALNSFGMPNDGFTTVAEAIRTEYPHPVVVSVAGFSVEDFVRGVEVFDRHPGVAAIELNCGCPNAHDQKTVPIAYDYESLAAILDAIDDIRVLQKPIWVKLSPLVTRAELLEFQRGLSTDVVLRLDLSAVPVVDENHFENVMLLMEQHACVHAVVFSNTLPNVVFSDDSGNPVTTPNGGKAGLSGRLLKPISLWLIGRATELLFAETFDFIGCGGVLTGEDAMDYIDAGASGVMATTGPYLSGNDPRFFAELISGSGRLQEYLANVD